MIRAEGVTKIFGQDPDSVLPMVAEGKSKDQIQAETGHIVGINNASFSVKAGEVFCIMGLSGSGKSTLIRCINRIIDPTDGHIFFDDPEKGEQDITRMGEEELRMLRRYNMSMVFQHFALFPHRSVLDNVIYGLEIQGRDPAESRQRGQEVLEMVGLGEWGSAYPHELSGGMQQRVGLARALATDAKVLLMDEPFSALDPLIKVNMQEELRNIQQKLNRTILFITHDLDEAMRIGDHIGIMEAGRMVQIGSPEEILVNPRTEYVARFVEHADPTGVISAGTIAVPLDSPRVKRVGESDGLTYFARDDVETLRVGVDSEGRLGRVSVNGADQEPRPLLAAIEGQQQGERRDDLVLTCDETTILRELLRGRSHTTMPVIVTAGDGRVTGMVDEPELISGILEKRGYGQGEAASEASSAPARSA